MTTWILDIGSGDKPNPKANVFLERFIKDTPESGRAGRKIIMRDNMIIGDAHFLPFKTNSISYIYSNHVIEHLNNPELFLNDCKRISDNICHTAPGLLNHIWDEILFNGHHFKSGHHQNVWNPISKQWISIDTILKAEPNYSTKRKIYILIIRLIPHSIREYLFGTLLYIMDDYLKNLDVNIVEYKYET